MVSDPLLIFLNIDINEAERELSLFEKMVDKLASGWEKVKRTITKETSKVIASIGALMRFAERAMKTAGMSIGKVGEAILHMVDSLVTTIFSVYVSYQSLGATNPIFLISAGLAFSALAYALHAEALATTGLQEAQSAAREASQLVSSFGSIFTPWGY